MIVPPMEEQRHEMKSLLLATRHALTDAGVPTKQKSDAVIPQFYACNSWEGQSVVPWNEAEKRVLYPAEGIEWLAAQGVAAAETIQALRAEIKVLNRAGRQQRQRRNS